MIGSDLSDKGAVGGLVNKKICDNCQKPSPVQTDVNFEGMTLLEQWTYRHVLGELPCKFGINCTVSMQTFAASLRWLALSSAAASFQCSVKGGWEATPVLDAISAFPRSQRDQGMLSVALELEARVR